MANAPVTTHQWLTPLYKWLNGQGSRSMGFGSSTGLMGFYGSTGLAPRVASGLIGLYAGAASPTAVAGLSGFAATGMGASGFYTFLGAAGFNGGTGSLYGLNDVIVALKNVGILKP